MIEKRGTSMGAYYGAAEGDISSDNDHWILVVACLVFRRGGSEFVENVEESRHGRTRDALEI